MKRNKTIFRLPKSEGGVALLEVLISVLMLSLGVLALVGLQANMNSNATDAKYRAEANYLANQLVGLMWVDQSHLASYAISGGTCAYANCSAWLSMVNSRLPGGSATVTINGTAVNLTVTWQTPGGGIPHSLQLVANVVS